MSDPEAIKIFESYIGNSGFKEFPSHEALQSFVDGQPVYGKLACVCKERPDGTIKRRTILDSKASAVKGGAQENV